MLTLAEATAAATVLTFLMLLTSSLAWTRGWTPAGMQLAFSNRDEMPPMSPAAGRARRAAANMVENMAIFLGALAALAAAQPAVVPEAAILGANLFFWSRLAYWPSYWIGIAVLRTVLWGVGIAGCALILWSAL